MRKVVITPKGKQVDLWSLSAWGKYTEMERQVMSTLRQRGIYYDSMSRGQKQIIGHLIKKGVAEIEEK